MLLERSILVRASGLVLLAGLTQAVSAADSVLRQLQAVEAKIIEPLRKSMKCESVSVAGEGNLYCRTGFRGLEVEFSGANAPGGGSIYINALGKNQTVTNLGSRCLVVIFNDEDLTVRMVGAHIIFRDDSVISGNAENEKARAACE